jgi:hypothetical protein
MRAPELEDHTNVHRKRIRVLSIYFYYIHIHTSPHFSDYPNYHQKNRREVKEKELRVVFDVGTIYDPNRKS